MNKTNKQKMKSHVGYRLVALAVSCRLNIHSYSFLLLSTQRGLRIETGKVGGVECEPKQFTLIPDQNG